MKPVINLYKPISLTPLQAIQKFKQQNPKYKDAKIAYAGRLDPMAEGILILLINNQTKKMNQYMKLNKTYQAKILFNFSSDTYDILGIPKNTKISLPTKATIKQTLQNFKGDYDQELPPYSSYKIKGKPLFHYARKNQLPKPLPRKTVTIKNIKINSFNTITSQQLLNQITKKISSVEGDFRQKKILKKWNTLLKNKKEKYLTATITIDCSSGTYIRAITNDLGNQLKTKALLLNLTRTKAGRFNLTTTNRLK